MVQIEVICAVVPRDASQIKIQPGDVIRYQDYGNGGSLHLRRYTVVSTHPKINAMTVMEVASNKEHFVIGGVFYKILTP